VAEQLNRRSAEQEESLDTSPEARLRELGIEIPEPAPSVANYIGAVRVGELLFVSGHGPYQNGEYVSLGKLGRELDVAAGQASARIVMLNFLATVREVLGSLDRVERIVKLLVMVNSAPDFGDQPLVANGASDLLVEIFGEERGKHGRSAVGMGALPMGISVEIEGILQVS
jgi:enamine deaminase RidA (YjgF/YER057c/UK114 family)